MSALGFLLLAVIMAVPVAWLVSEFRGGRRLRIALGVLAITFTTICVSILSNIVTRFNYNAWYGGATKDLIETSLNQIEDGN